MGEEANRYSKDSLARLLGVSSLVLSLCVFVALLVLAPWTLFRLWETSDKLYEKLDSEIFVALQTKVNELEHKITLFEVEHMEAKIEEENKPVVFPKEESVSTELPELGVVAKNKRSIVNKSSNGGTVYTRWGKSTCPYDASLLYTGVVAVSHASHTGGGSNHQCLPLNPEFGYQQKGHQHAVGVGGSIIVGVEYRADNIYPFDNKNNRGNSLHTEDAVCSICFVPHRSVSVMIPAQRSCPEGWTVEYKGYLMTSHYKSFRVDYICVDEAPEAKESGETTTGFSYLHPVEGYCGAIPCPNYTEGFEIACIVCTH